ncbi:MAG: hypothetical protein ABJE10_10440, partial [bacterium]
MAAGPRLTLAVVAVVLFVTAFVFSSLTIRVDSDHLTWHFGPGISSKSVARAAIAHAELTTTSALEGWGIHLTTRGWLYNVGGRRAVLITLHDRSQFLLGSDEPEVLVRALRSANSVRSPD